MKSLALAKCKNARNINFFLIILAQGFCPPKIRITQFPGGIRLRSFIVGALEQLDALPLLKLRHLYFPFPRTVRKKLVLEAITTVLR